MPFCLYFAALTKTFLCVHPVSRFGSDDDQSNSMTQHNVTALYQGRLPRRQFVNNLDHYHNPLKQLIQLQTEFTQDGFILLTHCTADPLAAGYTIAMNANKAAEDQ